MYNKNKKDVLIMKLIKRIILLLIILIAIAGGVLAYKGHKIYKDVL